MATFPNCTSSVPFGHYHLVKRHMQLARTHRVTQKWNGRKLNLQHLDREFDHQITYITASLMITWRQRHASVNNLPNVTMQWCPAGSQMHKLSIARPMLYWLHHIIHMPVMPPTQDCKWCRMWPSSYTWDVCRMLPHQTDRADRRRARLRRLVLHCSLDDDLSAHRHTTSW